MFDGQLDKIRLQKLLFLFTRSQLKAEYDFIPYLYGCFSYSANADLSTMVNRGILTETTSHFIIQEKGDYVKLLKSNDRQLLQEVVSRYGRMTANGLMKHTYVNFPYWGIHSKVAKDILSENDYEKLVRHKPASDGTVLFTIGYEGISLEEYLNRLIRNDVKILVDVRKNPLSMKYGFSKNQLKRYCEAIGIQYIHFPEVGIQSEDRQELNSQHDYDKLFQKYCSDNLPNTIPEQTKIFELLQKYKRIALTCFESDICQCHRKHLAEAIANLPGFRYEVKHIQK